MNLHKKSLPLAFGLSLLGSLVLVATESLAADADDWYLGVSVGVSNIERQDPPNTDIFQKGQAFSDSDMAYSLRAGRIFSDWFALELAYSDFGKGEDAYRFRPEVDFIVQPNDREALQAQSLSLAGRFSYQLGEEFSLFAKMGVGQQHYRSRYFGGMTGASPSHSDTATGWVLGLGGRYALSDSLALRAEINREQSSPLVLETASLGLDFSF